MISQRAWRNASANYGRRSIAFRISRLAGSGIGPRRKTVRREPPSLQDRPSERTLDQLVDYYRTKRLDFQRRFFRKRAEKHELFDRSSRHLGPLLFLGSVIAALTHFGIDLFHDGNGLHAASTQLILLAAALPVVGAGIRTLRTAYEFARNTSRYRAKAFVLDRLAQILRQETDSWLKLRELWYSEEILESNIANGAGS